MNIKRERLDFEPYLRALADLLALKDWRFVIKDENPADRDAAASTCIWYGRKRATIRFSEEFLRESEENQRHTSAHELIHCHLDTLERLATREVESGDLIRPIRLALELAVDGLADAIAPFLPLPGAILEPKSMAARTSAATHARSGTAATSTTRSRSGGNGGDMQAAAKKTSKTAAGTKPAAIKGKSAGKMPMTKGGKKGGGKGC